eukprot:SAG11_NODE_1439_length_4907_cov_2.082571_7_plen_76_part_00
MFLTTGGMFCLFVTIVTLSGLEICWGNDAGGGAFSRRSTRVRPVDTFCSGLLVSCSGYPVHCCMCTLCVLDGCAY